MRLCIPLYICSLTVAWISSEISTKLLGMPTHLDWSSLTAAGLYLIQLVCQMSSVDWSLPIYVSRRQLPSSEFLCPTPHWRSLAYSRSRRRSRAQAFDWFRAKIDKGIICFANHPHSVTFVSQHHISTPFVSQHHPLKKLRLIFFDGFWAVYIPFDLMDQLSRPVRFILTLTLRLFTAFGYNEIDRFVSFTT